MSFDLVDKFATIDGINVHFWDCGIGTPVLLLHGLGASVETWLHNIEDLSANHRVIALDLPGSGRSSRPLNNQLYSLQYAGQFLYQFVTMLGVSKLSLIGNSLGGALAIQFSLLFPEMVTKLILVDSAGLGREISHLFTCLSLWPVGEILLWPIRSNVERFAKALLYKDEIVTEQFVDNMLRISRIPGTKQSILKILRKGVDLRGQRIVYDEQMQRNLNMPILVVWGKQDPVLPLNHVNNALQGMHNCRAVILDQAGHAPQMDRAETFNQITLEFLERGTLFLEDTGGKESLFCL